MSHYHIRWSGNNKLDWERFDSDADAVAAAQQLKRLGETYTIEERDETCEHCRATYILKTGRDPQEPKPQVEEPMVQYPWQKAVLAAFNEMRPEFLQQKVNEAERVISARLRELTSADWEEQIAIRDALHSLPVLLPKRVKPNNNEKKATA